jgi:hypothetical protein
LQDATILAPHCPNIIAVIKHQSFKNQLNSQESLGEGVETHPIAISDLGLWFDYFFTNWLFQLIYTPIAHISANCD